MGWDEMDMKMNLRVTITAQRRVRSAIQKFSVSRSRRQWDSTGRW